MTTLQITAALFLLAILTGAIAHSAYTIYRKAWGEDESEFTA